MDLLLKARSAAINVPAGPAIWRRLHTLALAWDGSKAALEKAVSLTTNAIPCGACKRHWVQLIAEKPPTVETAEEFFALTVDWHNAVNERIGKPIMQLEDARALYAVDKASQT